MKKQTPICKEDVDIYSAASFFLVFDGSKVATLSRHLKNYMILNGEK